MEMKRISLLLVIGLLAACGGANNEYDEQLKESEKQLKEAEKDSERIEELSDQLEETSELIDEANELVDVENDDKSTIETRVEEVITTDLNNTVATNIRVNEDMSVDEERYIVLVDLEWDVKNKPKTTKEMLDMYSDHLAAKLSDNEMIYELVLFWTVPYHDENDSILKRTYENRDDGMYLEDEMVDVNVFNETNDTYLGRCLF